MLKTIFNQWEKKENVFLIEGDVSYSYQDFYQKIKSTLIQIPKHECVILEAENSINFYVRFLAALINDCKIVLCSKDFFKQEDYKNFLIDELKLKKIYFWSLHRENAEVVQNLKYRNEVLLSYKYCFVVRTSGSTGLSKLVLHSSERFIKKLIDRGNHFNRTLAFSPAYSIAGVETLLEVLSHGLTLINSKDNLNPKNIFDLIISYDVDYFQTTPSFLNLFLLSVKSEFNKIKNLKKIAFGSEPANEAVLKNYRDLLPNINLIQTYGMTEIGILKTDLHDGEITSIKFDKIFNDVEIKEGILWVKSKTQMIKYLNFSDSTLEINDGWFKTNDRAIFNESGNIKVLGRDGDIINVGGNKFYPVELEVKIKKLENVLDVIVIPEKNEFIGTTVLVKIFIEQSTDEIEFKKKLKIFLSDFVVHYMHPQKIKISKNIDEISKLKKIRREN